MFFLALFAPPPPHTQNKENYYVNLSVSYVCVCVCRGGGGTALINPFVPNGFSHPYKLDESIWNLRVVGY